MRRLVLVLATMALAILLAGGVAQAIINGEPDRGSKAHPYVGAYLAKFEGKLFPACSGTLISPRVFLTAGHCVEFEVEKDRPSYVSFDPTFKSGASRVTKGTPHLHPKFCIANPEDNVDCAPEVPGEVLFAQEDRYDVGVVVLEEPVRMATYGALPKVGLVDTLKERQRLAVVGYGVNRFDIESGAPPQIHPVQLQDRYRATVRLLNTIDPTVGEKYVKTTGVSIRGDKGESACYGDSGGPLFLPDQQTIVGVTAFATPGNLCRGPNYYQRVDLPKVLKWLRSLP